MYYEKRSFKDYLGSFARFFVLFLYLCAAVLPLVWIFLTSIKGDKELYSNPLVYWPKHPTFAAYEKLFTYANFGITSVTPCS